MHRKAIAGGTYIDAAMSHFSDLTSRPDGRSNCKVVSTFKLPPDPASGLGPSKKGLSTVWGLMGLGCRDYDSAFRAQHFTALRPQLNQTQEAFDSFTGEVVWWPTSYVTLQASSQTPKAPKPAPV